MWCRRVALTVPCFNRYVVANSDRSGWRSRFERRRAEDPVRRRDEALAFVADDSTWRPPDWFERIAVVLVETTDAVNIGGVVRSMANTGFLRLRLVNPVAFDAWQVGGIAHYTPHIVQATQIYDALAA